MQRGRSQAKAGPVREDVPWIRVARGMTGHQSIVSRRDQPVPAKGTRSAEAGSWP